MTNTARGWLSKHEGVHGRETILRNGHDCDLSSERQKTFAACGRACDFFTEEMIPGEYCGMTDGVYSWISSLAYYVEKYNLRLLPEFERYVLERGI